ncbi:protein of unknown function [Pseudomonas sp. JV241A]|nr:protein of unknown function [Pseudomonas sp. JV241A]
MLGTAMLGGRPTLDESADETFALPVAYRLFLSALDHGGSFGCRACAGCAGACPATVA